MALEMVHKAPSAAHAGEHVIAVASGKGGVGKTVFAISLAHAFSRLGKKALLFDGDLGLANVDIQLGLMPERDLVSVLEGKMTLKQSITRFTDAGFDIIAGRSGSGRLSSLPSQRLAALGDSLLDLEDSYDPIVMDLGAGVDRTVRVLGMRAKRCLVIATDEPTAITDAYAFIKIILAEQPETDIRSFRLARAACAASGFRICQTLKPGKTGPGKTLKLFTNILRHRGKVDKQD
jgi:flagellar biosynthesis protein FlhG